MKVHLPLSCPQVGAGCTSACLVRCLARCHSLQIVHTAIVNESKYCFLKLCVWRNGSARGFETNMDITCEKGFTEENRGPQHVRAYTASPSSGHYTDLCPNAKVVIWP